MKYLKKYNESISDIVITEDNYEDYFMELLDCGYEFSEVKHNIKPGKYTRITFVTDNSYNYVDEFHDDRPKDTIDRIYQQLKKTEELTEILESLISIKKRLEYTYDDKNIEILDGSNYNKIRFYII